ncbi:MAG: hypothetical protein KAS32_24400 [Candidatus Peribacteraceae bacterium]|nr:hypothetical protein [Candidatus Peribacteraceae bacterium]
MVKSISPSAIFQRTSLPLALFFMVFSLMLFLSKSFLLPALLLVEIDGETHSVEELKSYHDRLSLQVDEKKAERKQLVLPMEGTRYIEILDEKHSAYRLSSLTSAISQVAEKISSMQGAEKVVSVSGITYSPRKKSLVIIGNIFNVGPRSMTVLAQFIEELRSEPFVLTFHNPKFERKQDSSGKFYSPFNIQISL